MSDMRRRVGRAVERRRRVNEEIIERQGGAFRPGVWRVPWRVLRVTAGACLWLAVTSLLFWTGQMLFVLVGVVSGVMLLATLTIMVASLVRDEHWTFYVAGFLVAGGFVFLGGASFNDWYMDRLGTKADAKVTLVCEYKGSHRRRSLSCKRPVDLVTGRHIADDFERGNFPDADRRGPITRPEGVYAIYYDPSGWLAPLRAEAVEDPAKRWKAVTALALLVVGATLAASYGELFARNHPARRR